MAIAEMKRIGLIIMRRDHDRLLKFAQRLGCVQVTQTEVPEELMLRKESARAAEIEAEIARYQWAIRKLVKYDPVKQSMFSALPEVSVDDLEGSDLKGAEQVIQQAEELERRAGDLRGQESRLHVAIEQLTPWLQLDIPTEINHNTQSVTIFTGTVTANGLKELMAAWSGQAAVIRALEPVKDLQHFWAAVYLPEATRFLQDLQEIGFQQISLPEGQGTPQAQREAAEKALEALAEKQKALEEDLRKLAEQLPVLRLGYETLKAEYAREEAQGRMAHTATASLLQGWVPALAAPGVEAAIKERFPEAAISFFDPQEGEEPPVLLRNHPVTAPFESIITGFSMPHPSSLDPTAVMMPFFACFFGMMVSDAGYGLMMALLVPILIKLMKPSKGGRKLFWIVGIGGIFTVFWGAMYNTWFGFAPWPTVFDPVNNSLPVMALCIGLGALHLFTGLGLGAYLNIRRGQFLDAIYDQFSWFSLVVGLGLLLLPQTAELGKWMALAGAPGHRRPGQIQQSLQAPALWAGGAVQCVRLAERPAQLHAPVWHGACHRGDRHGHQPPGGHGDAKRYHRHHHRHPPVCGRAFVQCSHQRPGRLCAFKQASIHRVFRQVLRGGRHRLYAPWLFTPVRSRPGRFVRRVSAVYRIYIQSSGGSTTWKS